MSFSQTRSRLFHWRRLFIITAKKLVDPVMRSLPNNGARKHYVREALQYGGAAYFDMPDGQVCTSHHKLCYYRHH